MNADGSDPINLSNNAATDFDPAWSPDGEKIVFEGDRDGNVEIYAMNPDGTGQANLTNLGTAADFDPDWGVSTADTAAPRVNLSLGATNVATVTTGTKDLAGNALDQNTTTSGDQPKTWKFTIRK